MNNKNEYDFLRELTAADDRRISRVARKYPALDKSALKRINALCEEKLKMKENNNINNHAVSEEEKVEVISNIPWYRRPAFTAAACFVVLAGVTGGVMALFGGKNNDINPVDNMPPLSNVETSDAESTSDVTTEAATDTTTTESSAETTVEPTAETNIAAETTEQSNESIEMPDLVGKSYESSKDEYKDYFQLIAERSEYNDEYESGTIIEQSVNAGTNIEKGSAVKVIVSKGSQPENGDFSVDVPDDTRIDELLDALELAEAFMSNGVELDCDMDDNFTDESGQLYVKVTESGFNTIADVENYINKYLTEEFINSRYKALTDRNSGKFIEKENGLYICYAPKATSFYGIGEQKGLVIVRKTDDGTEVVETLVNYDEFGEPATLVIQLVEVSEDSWKINGFEENLIPDYSE